MFISELLLPIRSKLNDKEQTKYRWSDNELIDNINAGIANVSKDLLIFSDSKIVPYENGVIQYPLPQNMLKIASISIEQTVAQVKSYDWIANNKHKMSKMSALYVCFDYESFYLYADKTIKDGTNIDIKYYYIPQVSTPQCEIAMPIILKDAIVFYAMHLAHQTPVKEKNDQISMRWLELYEKEIAKHKPMFYSNKQSKSIRSKYRKV